MERISLSYPELERTSAGSITEQIRTQLEAIRDTTLARITELDTLAHDTQNTLDTVNIYQGVPRIILTINYIDVEYDVYTYSESITSSVEFVTATDNIEEAIELCAKQVSNSMDVSLGNIGLEIPGDTPLNIELKDTTQWKRLFMRRHKILYDTHQYQNKTR